MATREGIAGAIRLAHRALELDPRFGSVAALVGLCHALNVIWGYSNDPQFEQKEAVRLARLALSLDDGDPETLARAAVIPAFMVGDSEAEIETADRAVALNPNSSITWQCRGHVYRTAGLPEEAIRSFERGVRMSPVDPRLYMTLTGIGQALIELRRFDEAIVVLKKALRQKLHLTTYRCLASAFAYLGRDAEAHDAAARVLEGVLRIDFRDGAVRLTAGEMFVVPKGAEHKPYAEHEIKLLLIEPRGVLNTGHEGGGRTAEKDVWI